MFGLKDFLRRQLLSRGYLVTRIEPAIPPSLTACLDAIRTRSTPPVSVVCLDGEIRLQTQLLGMFPADRVVFATPILTADGSLPAPGTVLPAEPAGPFVVVIDLANFALASLWVQLPWLGRAETLLLRARLGSFWSGEIDLCLLQAEISRRGFLFMDVADLTLTLPLEAQSQRPTLVFQRDAQPGNLSKLQRYRVNEALAALSVPIARRGESRLLAGRGSFGFAAGVFNPGAITEAGRTLLVCRTERLPWTLVKTDESRFFAQPPPLLLKLGADQQMAEATELSLHGLPDPSFSRAEDFRLFRFRGEVYSNHAVISNRPNRPPVATPLRLDLVQTRLGLSRLDLPQKQLVWHGLPVLDRPLARTEKNWAMFTAGTRLFLLYSFSPYILLSATNWPGLDFATILETCLTLPFDGDGLALRNSINPVDYDDRHWLHVVHKVYPDKQYCYWAVLIDKTTLRPVRASARPLVRGWSSGNAAIIYVCSVIVRPAEVLVFAGVDDSGITVTAMSRSRLDAEMTTLPGTP